MARKTKNWCNRVLRWGTNTVGKPFKWGQTDCGSLVRKECGIIYLENIFPQVPNYSSLREAKVVWDKTGGIESSLKQVGAKEKPINYVRATDVVITDEEEFDFHAAMIYVRSGFIASSVDYGVKLLRRRDLPDDCYVLELPEEI